MTRPPLSEILESVGSEPAAIRPTKGSTVNGIQTKFYDQGLYRPRDGAMIAGVCAGVGRRFGLSAGMTRVLFILSLIVIPGSQILVYPILWILMPKEGTHVQPPTYGTPPMA
jgi:phage shock protein C